MSNLQPDGSIVLRIKLPADVVSALINYLPTVQRPAPHPVHTGRYTTIRPFLNDPSPVAAWAREVVEEKVAEILEQFGGDRVAQLQAEVTARQQAIRAVASPDVKEEDPT